MPIHEFQGVVYDGEAPESDDEILAFSNVKLKTGQEVTEVYQPSPTKSSSGEISVLQQCLSKAVPLLLPFKIKFHFIFMHSTGESNKMMCQHLNQLVQTAVVTASSQIIAAEQLLIQSQMKIQAASRTIKQANETADQILVKCNDVLTADFLPDIKLPS